MDRLGWSVAGLTLAASLALDLMVHRRGRSVSVSAAVVWTSIWVALGLAFGLVILALRGSSAMQDYYAAYLIEESLSLDNLFVFLVIFQSLRIPEDRQHQVLFFGVLGAALLPRSRSPRTDSSSTRRTHSPSAVCARCICC
jgi:tellurite resistance protein TerC